MLNVMALIFNVASTASLSAILGSSAVDILAERMMHMSLRFTLTALRSALLIGDPWRTRILGSISRVSHSLST